MTNNKKSSVIKTILIGAFVAAAYGMALYNLFLLSEDMIFGNSAGKSAIPQPFPGFFRIYDRPNTIEHNAINRLAADYAQVYFPSQEFPLLTKNYETGYLDPWERPSRYAPFIHYLCYISFCKVDYGYASFLHMLTQTLLFYLFFIFSFKTLKIESNMGGGLLLASILLFVTPAGLGWFERGQFSLYVALSYLLLILGLLKDKPALVLASALFAYVKWTSFPFLFLILATYILGSKNKKEFIKSMTLALAYAAIVLILSLAFRSKFLHFIEGLYGQELYQQPEGISMAQLLPENLVKILPFILTIPSFLYAHKKDRALHDLIPYFIGAGILMLTYPTIAFEYNIPNLLYCVPLVFYWTRQPNTVGKVIRYALFAFLLLISFPGFLSSHINKATVLTGYLTASIIFLLLPLLPKEFSHQLENQ